jgi:predicted RNA-binding Zn-ribbon protein involved in translation (DUF1610 family)
VGGDMTTGMDDSRFPFYCAHCGLVDVNTALAVSECPNCGTADIAQYGGRRGEPHFNPRWFLP